MLKNLIFIILPYLLSYNYISASGNLDEIINSTDFSSVNYANSFVGVLEGINRFAAISYCAALPGAKINSDLNIPDLLASVNFGDHEILREQVEADGRRGVLHSSEGLFPAISIAEIAAVRGVLEVDFCDSFARDVWLGYENMTRYCTLAEDGMQLECSDAYDER